MSWASGNGNSPWDDGSNSGNSRPKGSSSILGGMSDFASFLGPETQGGQPEIGPDSLLGGPDPGLIDPLALQKGLLGEGSNVESLHGGGTIGQAPSARSAEPFSRSSGSSYRGSAGSGGIVPMEAGVPFGTGPSNLSHIQAAGSSGDRSSILSMGLDDLLAPPIVDATMSQEAAPLIGRAPPIGESWRRDESWRTTDTTPQSIISPAEPAAVSPDYIAPPEPEFPQDDEEIGFDVDVRTEADIKLEEKAREEAERKLQEQRLSNYSRVAAERRQEFRRFRSEATRDRDKGDDRRRSSSRDRDRSRRRSRDRYSRSRSRSGSRQRSRDRSDDEDERKRDSSEERQEEEEEEEDEEMKELDNMLNAELTTEKERLSNRLTIMLLLEERGLEMYDDPVTAEIVSSLMDKKPTKVKISRSQDSDKKFKGDCQLTVTLPKIKRKYWYEYEDRPKYRRIMVNSPVIHMKKLDAAIVALYPLPDASQGLGPLPVVETKKRKTYIDDDEYEVDEYGGYAKDSKEGRLMALVNKRKQKSGKYDYLEREPRAPSKDFNDVPSIEPFAKPLSNFKIQKKGDDDRYDRYGREGGRGRGSDDFYASRREESWRMEESWRNYPDINDGSDAGAMGRGYGSTGRGPGRGRVSFRTSGPGRVAIMGAGPGRGGMGDTSDRGGGASRGRYGLLASRDEFGQRGRDSYGGGGRGGGTSSRGGPSARGRPRSPSGRSQMGGGMQQSVVPEPKMQDLSTAYVSPLMRSQPQRGRQSEQYRKPVRPQRPSLLPGKEGKAFGSFLASSVAPSASPAVSSTIGDETPKQPSESGGNTPWDGGGSRTPVTPSMTAPPPQSGPINPLAFVESLSDDDDDDMPTFTAPLGATKMSDCSMAGGRNVSRSAFDYAAEYLKGTSTTGSRTAGESSTGQNYAPPDPQPDDKKKDVVAMAKMLMGKLGVSLEDMLKMEGISLPTSSTQNPMVSSESGDGQRSRSGLLGTPRSPASPRSGSGSERSGSQPSRRQGLMPDPSASPHGLLSNPDQHRRGPSPSSYSHSSIKQSLLPEPSSQNPSAKSLLDTPSYDEYSSSQRKRQDRQQPYPERTSGSSDRHRSLLGERPSAPATGRSQADTADHTKKSLLGYPGDEGRSGTMYGSGENRQQRMPKSSLLSEFTPGSMLASESESSSRPYKPSLLSNPDHDNRSSRRTPNRTPEPQQQGRSTGGQTLCTPSQLRGMLNLLLGDRNSPLNRDPVKNERAMQLMPLLIELESVYAQNPAVVTEKIILPIQEFILDAYSSRNS